MLNQTSFFASIVRNEKISRLRADFRFQVVLPVAITIVILSAGLFHRFTDVSRSLLDGQLEKRGTELSERFTHDVRLATLADDREALDELANGTLHDEDVSYVLVVNADGLIQLERYRLPELRSKILSSLPLRSDQVETDLGTISAENGDRYLQITTPMTTETTADDGNPSEVSGAEVPCGYTVVGMSYVQADAALASTMKSTALMTVWIVAIALGAILVAIREAIVPLKRIAESAEAIASGDLTQRVKTSARDEIGTLAKSFNTMIRSLRAKDRKIRADQDSLQKKNAELRELDQKKSEFLANMSHELRTPLNAIIGFSEVLRDRCFGDLGEKQMEYVCDIRESGAHLLSLINDILDLSKIEAGMMTLRESRFDLSRTIRRSTIMIKEKAGRKGIIIDVRIDNIPPTIKADERKIKQVIYNLLSNAVKFTPRGGKIRLEATTFDENVVIAVIDSGIGIADENQERIFDKFEQVDSSAAREYEGTGLGLALTRAMVEVHGGTISVESNPGRGSTFRFTIPCTTGETDSLICDSGDSAGVAMLFGDSEVAEATPQPEPITNALAAPESKGKILVIDDDRKTATLMADCLSQAGYSVDAAYNGEQAYQKLSSSTPDAIVLDLLLPDVDGWRILSRLKADQETRQIPVLISSILDERERGYSVGAADYIVKPFNKNILLNAVTRILSGGDGKGDRRMLIIDDDPDAISLIKAMTDGAGLEIESAMTGTDGVRLSHEWKPDLILLDFLLPDLACLETIKQIRSRSSARSIPIILITAKDLTEQERSQLRGEIEFFSSKSDLDPHSLKEEIDALIRTQTVSPGSEV